MKKLTWVSLAMVVLMMITACNKSNIETPESVTPEAPAESPGESEMEPESPAEEVETPSEEGAGVTYTVDELYPFEENVYRVYEGMGNEFAGYDEYVDFLSDSRIQLRRNNGGTEIVSVLEKKDGMLVEIISKAETYYKENFLDKDPEENKILLKEPLTLDASWDSEGQTATVTGVDVEVKTGIGTFTALEVTRVTKGKESEKRVEYYVRGMGLVKVIDTGKDYEVSATLTKMEGNAVRKRFVNFYYPNAQDERIFLYRKEISFTTNDIPKILIINAYKELPKEAVPVLTKNTKVNYLYLNQDGRVYLDLTKEFLQEMNAGAGYEGLILQSLANTIGDYYGVSKVMLTIDGKTYESGHIVLEKFEALEVNYDSIVDMN
ncbi:GerMN domain-containing protein [Proteiniclasticum sp.]|uniref:GerMN domain-containing protein n=1 Tax=Proteiniclasticum sp. TaxID=2053595 RepID=UPI0028A021AF|nr:GerMN domain-containing protein [Proteiniclasticum sp.]